MRPSPHSPSSARGLGLALALLVLLATLTALLWVWRQGVEDSSPRPRGAGATPEAGAELPVAWIRLGAGKIRLNGRAVQSLADVDLMEPSEAPLTGLLAALRALPRPQKPPYPEETPHARAAICGRADLPFRLLERVLFTLRHSGHDALALGVLPPNALASPRSVGGGLRTLCRLVPIRIPRTVLHARTCAPPEMRIRLRVTIDAGYTLTAGHERLAIPRTKGGRNHAKLKEVLADIRTRLPRKDDLEIAPRPAIPLRAVVQTLRLAHAAGFTWLELHDTAGRLGDPHLDPMARKNPQCLPPR